MAMCKWVPAAQMPEVSVACQRALLVQIAVAEVPGRLPRAHR